MPFLIIIVTGDFDCISDFFLVFLALTTYSRSGINSSYGGARPFASSLTVFFFFFFFFWFSQRISRPRSLVWPNWPYF